MFGSSPPQRTRLALVGAGRVGTGVAALLRFAGHQVVGVHSRSPESATRAAERLEAPVVERIDDLPLSDVVLIGAPESAIEEVASALALRAVPGMVVVHLAGAYGLSPLRPVIHSGARGAALHPVQAMPSVERALQRLRGSAWGVTCPEDLRGWAHALIKDDLGGHPIDVAEDDRPLWHAASVTTSNGIAGLMSAGERILASIGIEHPETILGPLAAGTVANARDGGGGSATLTGPAVRGERDTIERHLDALRSHAPHLVHVYSLAARLVLDGAEAGERIDQNAADELRGLLEEAQ
jgi:predicted short-subunit dehydrogenase-like oxidoreductase (DUF2520 family)